MAVIAGAATVASAGVGIAGSLGAFGGGKSGGGAPFPQYRGEFKPIPGVQFNPAQMGGDLMSLYPFLQQAANQATAYSTRQREKIMPGSKEQFRQAGEVLNSYLRGEIPQDVIDQTNRIVAQRTGGGFNPQTGGGQAPSAFARSIGRTSLDVTNLGLSAAPTWQQLADSFVVKPQEFGSIALGLGQQRYAYDALNTNIDMFNEQGQIAGATADYNAARDQWGAADLASQQRLANTQGLAQGIGALGGQFASLASTYRGGGPTTAMRPLEYRSSTGQMVPDIGQYGNYLRSQWAPSTQSAAGTLYALGDPYKTGRRR